MDSSTTQSQLEAAATALRAHPGIADVALERPSDDADALLVRVVPRDHSPAARPLGFSLFYFADAEADARAQRYRLYLDGARFADAHDFQAVWTPERHFHENGGLYPNPSVLSAALATVTERVRLRAGSVALPLHNPLRVAEEWSVVDNLSNGRVDVSFTSGWIPNDFALAADPGVFARKRDVMFESLKTVERLWRRGRVPVRDGVGNHVELEIFPKPVQTRLPVWITCSGDPSAFVRAGELGYNILTALLTQPLEEAAEKVRLYRDARARVGLEPDGGHVTLMMHTFVGNDEAEVLARVKRPLTDYLKSHIDLMKTMVSSLNISLDDIDLTQPKWAEYLASFAFERYYRMGSLIGTPDKCLEMVGRVKELGFDEVACLIDFGVPVDAVLGGLMPLAEVKRRSDATVGIDRARVTRDLEATLGQAPERLQLVIVDRLPGKNVARAASSIAPAEIAAAVGIDARAEKQKQARERQKQLMRMGRGQ
ncbi:MAG TPA: MupA/Atu3671 family FMN-dependent luciferase-like monooxygenase [Polyangia bacterium]|jgi:natural product biosynthesis luciferase-like monooxygenase protein|nr:MupA/Atu3671 family FMN-dependent luciferase-like monooxygenase [Polyangia bacterium]